jgi:Fe-S cluster biogenesis protein NfuA
MRGLYHQPPDPRPCRKPRGTDRPYHPPVTESETTNSVFLRVGNILQQIRPAIQADGGDVELVEVTDEGLVRVRFHGACVGCPSATMTLKTGIEHSLRERVPEVTGVEAVTD